MITLPITAVIPTRNRAAILRRTLESLLGQAYIPSQLVVVDGSETGETEDAVLEFAAKTTNLCVVTYTKALQLGAATQRNQGVELATQSWIWFIDDDILFEPDCIICLWRAAQSGADVGGVNCLITNQRYQPPRLASRIVFLMMAGRNHVSYAGMVIGPAVNLLPDDNDNLPEIVSVEWLNTTCTLYRRAALPSPPFDSIFTGYSLMEDLTLSLRVGAGWKLLNARTARIFHDSQPGSHKSDLQALSAMELTNRHYVMTQVLKRSGIADYLRLIAWEVFQMAALVRSSRSPRTVLSSLAGKLIALQRIAVSKAPSR